MEKFFLWILNNLKAKKLPHMIIEIFLKAHLDQDFFAINGILPLITFETLFLYDLKNKF
jgi:hypothetical protein